MKSERIFQTLSETDEELLCLCERDMKSRYHGGTHHSLLRWCAGALPLLLVYVFREAFSLSVLERKAAGP